jgi:uncharacterized protein YhhL (DUF1145 family)
MDEKAQFDALHALSEQAWRDWDHKTRHEWRLSFGLWAALLAASAALLQAKYRPDLTFVAVTGIAILVLHVIFLAWMQGTLRAYRKEYLSLRARMPAATRPEAPNGDERCWCASPSVWTQAGITLLLIGVFTLVAMSKAA